MIIKRRTGVAATVAIVVGILSALLSTQPASSLPTSFPGTFRLDLVVDGLEQPTSVTFLPDGRMLVTEKTGALKIVDEGATLPAAAATYLTIPSVDTEGERGVLDVVLDPQFAENGYLYVFQTVEGGWNRVVRYTHFENAGGTTSTADPASAFVVWQNPNPVTSCCHMGGGIAFGSDGLLYITAGEDFTAVNSQNPAHGGGKIHRVAKDGTVPANPWADGAGPNLESVWAIGLRNPFRARWDTISDRLVIGTVGGNVHSRAWEDVHVGRAGANYGWPDCGEGTTGRNPDGSCTNPVYDDPLFSYPHAGGEASVTGGVRYAGSAFPSELHGAYFYADFARGWMRYLTFTPSGAVASDNPFLSLPTDDAGNIVDIKEGPDGALYYVQIAGSFPVGTVVNSCNAGCLRRVVYETDNAAPIITTATASPPSGPAPLTVEFAATATDPESDPLEYAWAFGDGGTATGANPTHTFTTAGNKSVVLSVSDGNHTSTTTINVAVGVPADLTISSPADGSTFRAGDVLSLVATATDTDGPPPPPSSYSWLVQFKHNDHLHPVLGPTTGSSASLTVPSTGHSYNGETSYMATVTVTDSDGLVSTSSVQVFPDEVDLTIETVPPGLEVRLDGIPTETAAPYDTVIGFTHQIQAADQCMAGTRYQFASWSDGGASAHDITVPATDTTYTATFQDMGACDPPAAGVVLRLVGDDAVRTGGVVSSWPDNSGLGNNLTPLGGAPAVQVDALNGHDIVAFDGVDDGLTRNGFAGAPTGASDRTVAMLVRYESDGWGGLSWGSPLANRTFGVGVADSLTTAPLAVQGWGAGNDFTSGSDAAGGGWMVQTVVLGANQFQHFRDGTLVQSASHAFNTTNSRIRLGVEIDGSPSVAMSLAEAIVYNRALTPSERALVEGYLIDRYLGTGGGGPDVVAPVVAPGQALSVSDAATEGTVVGTVSATDNSGVTGFAIIGGDPSGVFAIDGAGQLTVSDPTTLDAAVTPSYTLSIQAADAAGNTGMADVVVTVTGEPPPGLPLGAVLRLEADAGLVTSGSQVTGWQDQGTSGSDLTAVGGPTLGVAPSGAPAVVFDGSGDTLQRLSGVAGLPGASADRTAFMMAKYESNGYGGFAWGAATPNQTFGLIAGPPTSGNLMVQGWGSANDFNSGDAGAGQGWLIQSAVVDDNALQHFRDGTLIDARTHTFATGSSRVVLGAEIDGSPQMSMSVAAVIVYDRALTPAERAQVRAYLDAKYLTPPSGPDTTPPTMAAGQSFEVFEGAAAGSAVGVVQASDNVGVTSYQLVGGAPDEVFAISGSGVITLTDPAALDATTTPSYTLAVLVADAAGNTTSGSVTVDVSSVTPVLPASGVVLHLVGDDAAASGGTVTSWADASGRGNTLDVGGGSPSLQPGALNGHSVVAFDGADDWMGRTGFAGAPTKNSDRTVLMVVRYDSPGWGGLSWGAAMPNRTFGVGVASGAGNLGVQGWGVSNDADSGDPGSGQGWMVQSVVVSGGTMRHTRDGVLVDTAPRTYDTSNARIRLGVEIDGSPAVAMSVAEAVVYDRALTPAELSAAQAFLRTKFLG